MCIFHILIVSIKELDFQEMSGPNQVILLLSNEVKVRNMEQSLSSGSREPTWDTCVREVGLRWEGDLLRHL